jgi:predicted nucleic acid-binding protein
LKGLVLDCSVTLAWLYHDGPTDYVEGVFDLLRNGVAAIVPPLWYYELANGLITSQRHQRVPRSQVRNFLNILGSLPIQFNIPDWGDAVLHLVESMDGALAHKLTAYDNAYLAIALQLHLPLASLDRELRRAAKVAGIADAVTG